MRALGTTLALLLTMGCSGSDRSGPVTAHDEASPAPTGSGETEPGETETGPTETGPTETGPTEPGPTETPTEPGPTETGPTETGPTETGPTGWFAAPRTNATIFATGHSLIDGVFEPPAVDGGPLTALARAAGKQHHSTFQSAPGSTARARHEDLDQGRYAAPAWRSFDTLVVTERADPHSTVIFERTLEEVGWFVDRVPGAAPDQVFLYQSWWGFSDGNPPTLSTWRAWAGFVREELPLYECIAGAVGHRRGVHVRVLPAALALAALMEAVEAGRVPGVRPYDVFARDNVHPAALGNAYLAMVVFASVYRTPTAGLEVPGVPAAARASLAAIADRVVGEYYARAPAPTVASCRATLSGLCDRHGQGCNYYLDQAFPDGSL
ncbi:MAG: hypothetical protein H6719_10445 [Sandaracinaceae bacterium]|nr:hypothetical protein [Sandaracinaceae bacterium]